MARKQEQHTKIIDRIAQKPSIVGIDGAVASCIEPRIFDRFGNVVSNTDILVVDSMDQVYAIEYKCSVSKLARATQQLSDAHDCLKRLWGIDAVRIYAHSKINYMRID